MTRMRSTDQHIAAIVSSIQNIAGMECATAEISQDMGNGTFRAINRNGDLLTLISSESLSVGDNVRFAVESLEVEEVIQPVTTQTFFV